MAVKKEEGWIKDTVEAILRTQGVTYEEWLNEKHEEFLSDKENKKKLKEIYNFYIEMN
ncbi:hypothetical protein K5V21_12670 [Clostridium sardiniense]|uniref:Uncharacterized protein n=1 Tax=Clostridium sardiniense TaxID=29369 RepID=A0ABS7KZR4_CLOSR|nr:hypothetical protein [Clostridium sardiniense]MBY0756301.1 hypothetical protein [Clostridium sardiniense]MDQ0461455.1 hypothetical protein [Clostridium sardiniense]